MLSALSRPLPKKNQEHVLTFRSEQFRVGLELHCDSVLQTDAFWLFRVSVSPECVAKYNELKLGKTIKYIIYRLSDDYKEIIVEFTSTDDNWEEFQEKLLNAKASHKGKEGKGPRYAVYDFQYELEGGEGTRYGVSYSWFTCEILTDLLQKQDCFYFMVPR